jgi:large subunit ribosomal protein L29
MDLRKRVTSDAQATSLEDLERRYNELEGELKEMPTKIEQAYQELFNLRFRLATRQLEDTSQIRKVRRQVARLNTTLSEMKQERTYIESIRRGR